MLEMNTTTLNVVRLLLRWLLPFLFFLLSHLSFLLPPFETFDIAQTVFFFYLSSFMFFSLSIFSFVLLGMTAVYCV